MRPPRKAGGNRRNRVNGIGNNYRFNEAPAKSGGELVIDEAGEIASRQLQ